MRDTFEALLELMNTSPTELVGASAFYSVSFFICAMLMLFSLYSMATAIRQNHSAEVAVHGVCFIANLALLTFVAMQVIAYN